MTKPSGWLQAVCITAIVLGTLGILTALYSLTCLVTATALRGGLGGYQTLGKDPAEAQVQKEMSERLVAVNRRWVPMTVPLFAAEILCSTGMIVAAAQTLRRRPGGRRWLVGLFIAAVFLELAQLVPAVAVWRENTRIMADVMPRLVTAPTRDGKPVPAELGATGELLGKGMVVFGLVGIAFTIFLAAAQIGFYVLGVVYLRRPNIREYFSEPTVAELVNGP